MRVEHKCNYCKKYFNDLYCLENPEREICEECLEKHPRLNKKEKNQFEEFIRVIQDFAKESGSIILDIEKATKVLTKSLAESKTVRKNLQHILPISK
jgi:tRNA G26 N,N-dimethylase Trm1